MQTAAALIVTLVLLVLLALPAGAQAQAPPLRAKLSACQSGPAAMQRTATFVGSMPAVAGTKRMWMRFDLFERVAPATDFAAVKAPKLGVWQKSAPGRASSGFVFTQRVQGLTALDHHVICDVDHVVDRPLAGGHQPGL